jgi:ankyrin repeat protein
MLAAYHGRAELVRFLLSRGAQPDRLNERGQSALSGAVFKGWTEVVRALVQAGADIRAGNPNAIDCAYMYVCYSVPSTSPSSYSIISALACKEYPFLMSLRPLERFKRDDYWQLLGASVSEISSDVPQRIP